MEHKNTILNSDSYKFSHYEQYPIGTKFISSYIEPRWNKDGENEVVFFGLQAFIKEYLMKKIDVEDIDEAEHFAELHGVPFNRKGWDYILSVHDGYLPLKIDALPEGTVHKLGVPQVQITNTDPEVPWLVSYIETAILRAVWYPSTVASISRNAKKIIYNYLKLTCDSPDEVIDFKLHDFGARGASSYETASLGGMAHLINFKGTDTVGGILYAKKYYGEEMAGFSIPASEHSTATSFGSGDGEYDYVDRILSNLENGKYMLHAAVADSFDLFNFIENILGKHFRDRILNLENKTLVVRPDSGVPEIIVVKTLEKLGRAFGYTINSKGYKVLPSCIRIIQGDGITLKSIPTILKAVKEAGWSTENLAMGMGGGLLQNCNRDTYGYAMKANAIKKLDEINWTPIGKNPKTDSLKKSKFGVQAVVDDGHDLISVPIEECVSRGYENKLQTVFMNGSLLKVYSFNEVRLRVKE